MPASVVLALFLLAFPISFCQANGSGRLSGGVCGIQQNGDAWTDVWSNNGDINPSVFPGGNDPWLLVSCGALSGGACGIREEDGTAWCSKPFAASTPTSSGNITGDNPWIQISMAHQHACGIQSDSSAWCWGTTALGSSVQMSGTPVKVPGPGGWMKIQCAYQQTLAIKEDGSLWHWRGDKAPSQIMSGRTWKQIAANTFDNNYACILSSDTSVWCYDWSNADYNTMAPTKLSSTGFISITTGITSDAEYFGCGLKEGGVGWCWGRFPLDSSISGTSDPSPMSYDASWVQLSGGATRGSLCGVKKDGSAWCWYVNKNIPGTATSKASLGTPTKVPLTGSWLAPITPSPPPLSPPPSPPSRPPPSTAPGSSSPPAPSAPQQEDNSSSNSSSSSRNTGAIVGGIIGGLVAVALIAVLAVYVIKKKQERHGDSENPNNNNNINNQGAHPGGHPMLLPTGPPPTSSLMTNTKSTTTNNTLSSAYSGPSAPFLSSLTASKNPAVRSDPLLNWVAASLQSTGPSSIITFPTGGGLVDVRPWQFSFAELEIEKPIGSGSYGKVYLATWHETKVAVKILLDMEAISGGGTGSNGPATTPPTSATGSVLSLDSPVLQNLQEEAAMMASLRHPNIVQFLGVCPFPPCILSEYCSRGNLTEVLYAAKTNPAKAAELTWHRRLSLAMDAAQGMLFLHTRSPPVVHRDFKSPNLLIDGSWRAKISDFNLSRIMEESTSTRTSTIGGAMNPRWLSVEVLCGAKPGPSADVFAFGVVLWELLTMEVPWESTNPWMIVSTIQKGGRLPVPDLATLQSRWGPGSSSCTKLDKYIALMQRCWAQDPGQRPAFAQVIHDLRYVDITGDDCCC